ncbi:MAG: esterase/lipase family protein [Candidatus Brachytrichaceae bacterium NZ_4S206]|jgi:pimeloyl-ACP methyl ester carboxylesterase
MTTPGVPPHILVFVPGYMGSTLRDRRTGRTVWLDFSTFPINPARWDDWLDDWFARMTYPSELEADGIVDDVVFVPPFVKMEQYGRLFTAMARMGYRTTGDEREVNFYTFPYDWRQDNRISARQLGTAIERWRNLHPGAQVWIIAHSNGGVVARWCIEKEGGKDVVQRLFLMGSPYDGTPKAMRIAFNGADMLGRPSFQPFDIARRTRDMFRSFPSLYQLLPVKTPFLRDLNGADLSAFDAPAWLDDARQRTYLEDGRRFTETLGDAASVETLCFFGRRRPTLTHGVVHAQANDRWERIEWVDTAAGDGTILERSAAHPQAAGRFPFAVGHGDIYVNPAVLEFLRWELLDKYEGLPKELVATETLIMDFAPDRDSYRENETIWLRAKVMTPDDQLLAGATVTVRMSWERPLPGDPPPDAIPTDIAIKLVPLAREPGLHEGLLYGPSVNGYYRLVARVEHPEAGAAQAEELIAVETPRY